MQFESLQPHALDRVSKSGIQIMANVKLVHFLSSVIVQIAFHSAHIYRPTVDKKSDQCGATRL